MARLKASFTRCACGHLGAVHDTTGECNTDYCQCGWRQDVGLCEWCGVRASGTAKHNDGLRHLSCGQPDHGMEFLHA